MELILLMAGQYTEEEILDNNEHSQGGDHRPESTNRVAMATFWRAFHLDGKFSPSW
jgi:hypothetical protein